MKQMIRKRVMCMLRLLAHRSCLAVVFRTAEALTDARRLFGRIHNASKASDVLAKAVVITPACPAISDHAFRAKWATPKPLAIVFCGRDFHVKNGHLALAVFREIRKRQIPVRLTYIGPIPTDALREYKDTLESVSVHYDASHDRVLEVFAASHVLLHPAVTENFGVVFVEACAAGMSLVTATGPGMEHTASLFGPHCGCLIDRTVLTSPEAEAAAYVEYIQAIACQPMIAQRHALNNYVAATTGPLSLAERNRKLSCIYAMAAGSRDGAPLDIARIARKVEASVLSMTDAELEEDLYRFEQERGLAHKYVVVQARDEVF